MFRERGFEFTHEAVRDWEARFAPLIADQLRAKRRGQAGRSWYVDETYVNVKGKWCDLYRAIDRDCKCQEESEPSATAKLSQLLAIQTIRTLCPVFADSGESES